MRVKKADNSPWWAKRWTEALAAYSTDSRFQRGRTYARQGNVIEVNITKGLIEAKVQGSRPRPYRCSIRLKQFSVAQWESIVMVIASQAAFSAQMLKGELPEAMDDIFQQTDVSLFPQTLTDLSSACSCPDIVNPCKHIVAVLMILGQEFGRDPYLVFTLRGKTQAELLKDINRERAKLTDNGRVFVNNPKFGATIPVPPDFWGSAEQINQLQVPELGNCTCASAALRQMLGWPDDHPFQENITAAYRQIKDKVIKGGIT